MQNLRVSILEQYLNDFRTPLATDVEFNSLQRRTQSSASPHLDTAVRSSRVGPTRRLRRLCQKHLPCGGPRRRVDSLKHRFAMASYELHRSVNDSFVLGGYLGSSLTRLNVTEVGMESTETKLERKLLCFETMATEVIAAMGDKFNNYVLGAVDMEMGRETAHSKAIELNSKPVCLGTYSRAIFSVHAADGIVNLWDPRTPRVSSIKLDLPLLGKTATFHNDSASLIIGHEQGALSQWRMGSPITFRESLKIPHEISSVSVYEVDSSVNSPRQAMIVLTSFDCTNHQSRLIFLPTPQGDDGKSSWKANLDSLVVPVKDFTAEPVLYFGSGMNPMLATASWNTIDIWNVPSRTHIGTAVMATPPPVYCKAVSLPFPIVLDHPQDAAVTSIQWISSEEPKLITADSEGYVTVYL